MSAPVQVTRDAVAHFLREIAFYVIGQFLPDLPAIDFYNHRVDLHGKVQAMGSFSTGNVPISAGVLQVSDAPVAKR